MQLFQRETGAYDGEIHRRLKIDRLSNLRYYDWSRDQGRDQIVCNLIAGACRQAEFATPPPIDMHPPAHPYLSARPLILLLAPLTRHCSFVGAPATLFGERRERQQ